jgi:hypothetical protein
MHTSAALTSEDFRIVISGRPATLDAVLPGLDEHDRLGIVITETWGAAGASTLILAAVTAFYDRLRATEADFFAYPDFFAFHVGAHRGTLRKLDVFPDHKEVVVPNDPEALGRAINDRGVTRLLVPGRPGPATKVTGRDAIARDTRHSARRRIRTALAYSPTGRVANPDVEIAGSAQTESFVTAMLEAAGPAERPSRGDLVGPDGRPEETFRRLSIDDALTLLETASE